LFHVKHEETEERQDDLERDHAICDYEGTSYRARFWEGTGREYEDLVERIALRHLLPTQGRRIVELGASFGRLADLYQGYEQIILLDYAKSGLREAQERLGRSSKYIYVAADIYHLPLARGACDTAVTVRVLHHLNDAPAALRGIAEILEPNGAYVLEYANKRNIKAVARYALRRQNWSPFAPEPYEFAELNFDFHPDWMAAQLKAAGFRIEAGRAVSHFRQNLFKRLVSASTLARIDGAIQAPSAACKLTPSVFLRTSRSADGPKHLASPFCCPSCRSVELATEGQTLKCGNCRAVWAIDDGIYDFKNPAQKGTGR
jgi:SAM-dependent methyltransferase